MKLGLGQDDPASRLTFVGIIERPKAPAKPPCHTLVARARTRHQMQLAAQNLSDQVVRGLEVCPPDVGMNPTRNPFG
jgi:hypothetical protein